MRARHAVRASYRRHASGLVGAALFVVLAGAGAAGLTHSGCTRDVHDLREVRQGECVSCHLPDYEATENPVHEGLFPTTCADCHDEDEWVPARGFGSHDWFPLTEGHAGVACASCHTEGYGEGQTPTDCVGCHRDDYDRSPFPGHNVFPTTCTDCHDTRAWIPSSFQHEWPLDGAHVGTPCAGCHVGEPPVYDGTPTECVDCHRGDYERSTFPGHDAFPTTCADCHTTTTWRGPSFTHPWPLEGAHSWAPCSSCHTGDPPRYEGTPTDCVSCHRDDYERSDYPGHNVFPTTCTTCHGTTTWIPSTFVHDWPLTGAHVGTRCESCHTGDPPRYEGTPNECAGCHRGDYDRAVARIPSHATYPETCAECHTTETWLTADFDHPWPLTGAHGWAPCASCHTGEPPRYDGTPTACVDCHRADYDASTHPGHDRYPLTCTECHGTSAWRPSTFAHPWPLTGAHAGAGCASCHGDPPTYDGTPMDCVSCHRADYDASTYPGHRYFPTTCADCHSTSSFRPATFVHPFPLTFAHASATCASCHGDPPTYAGTPSDCASCHRDDYDRAVATVPSHDTYSTTCTDCHSVSAWRPSSFTHPWPLVGAHATAECAGCHTGSPPRYEGTPRDCLSCHADDRARATFPGHASFPATCGDCHSSFTWLGATFAHPWPLAGAHALAPCASCHTGSPPRYDGTPTDCASCHRDDYDRSPYPPHSTFPLTCMGCHGPTGWVPATSGYHPERAFGIASGPHRQPCVSCHLPSLGAWTDGMNVACVGCHDRAREDAEHRGEPGYPTGPAPVDFCRDCHPAGR